MTVMFTEAVRSAEVARRAVLGSSSRQLVLMKSCPFGDERERAPGQ
jgi:hypothetical protein